ncbi:MAG TPA: phosphatidylserine decarboxylase [Methylovirgula sp.]
MSVINSIRKQIPPIHPEGYIFIAIFAVITLVAGWIFDPLFWIGLLLTIWCALFFRDPLRVTPQASDLVISPADGKVSAVGLAAPPPELGLGADPLLRISIFMSVFNVHVNRAPMAGRVAKIAYRPGVFLNADLDKASEDNERNGLVIDTAAGRIGVVQIAGLIARRIVCFVEQGDSVDAGERFGLIRFGSRVDVYLPHGTRALVAEGATAIGGETILADFHADEPARLFKLA